MKPHTESVAEYQRRRAEENWHGERPWPACALPPGVQREEELFHHGNRNIALRLLRHEFLLGLAGVVGIVLLALVLLPIAANALGAVPALMTILFLGVLIAFATAPVWMAALVDDYEDHKSELGGD